MKKAPSIKQHSANGMSGMDALISAANYIEGQNDGVKGPLKVKGPGNASSRHILITYHPKLPVKKRSDQPPHWAKDFLSLLDEHKEERANQKGMLKRKPGNVNRRVHNECEKKRRSNMKECYDLVKQQLPTNQYDVKSSNLNILHNSLRYIQMLQRVERQHAVELEKLAREKISLQQKLATLKREVSVEMGFDLSLVSPDSEENYAFLVDPSHAVKDSTPSSSDVYPARRSTKQKATDDELKLEQKQERPTLPLSSSDLRVSAPIVINSPTVKKANLFFIDNTNLIAVSGVFKPSTSMKIAPSQNLVHTPSTSGSSSETQSVPLPKINLRPPTSAEFQMPSLKRPVDGKTYTVVSSTEVTKTTVASSVPQNLDGDDRNRIAVATDVSQGSPSGQQVRGSVPTGFLSVALPPLIVPSRRIATLPLEQEESVATSATHNGLPVTYATLAGPTPVAVMSQGNSITHVINAPNGNVLIPLSISL